MGWMLSNSNGEKSASLTIMIIGFAVVTLWLLLSIFSKIGHFEIRPFSGNEAMMYLGPLLATYYGRRWTDGKMTMEDKGADK